MAVIGTNLNPTTTFGAGGFPAELAPPMEGGGECCCHDAVSLSPQALAGAFEAPPLASLEAPATGAPTETVYGDETLSLSPDAQNSLM